MCVFGELLWRFLKAHTPSLAHYAQAAEERAGGAAGPGRACDDGTGVLVRGPERSYRERRGEERRGEERRGGEERRTGEERREERGEEERRGKEERRGEERR